MCVHVCNVIRSASVIHLVEVDTPGVSDLQVGRDMTVHELRVYSLLTKIEVVLKVGGVTAPSSPSFPPLYPNLCAQYIGFVVTVDISSGIQACPALVIDVQVRLIN